MAFVGHRRWPTFLLGRIVLVVALIALVSFLVGFSWVGVLTLIVTLVVLEVVQGVKVSMALEPGGLAVTRGIVGVHGQQILFADITEVDVLTTVPWASRWAAGRDGQHPLHWGPCLQLTRAHGQPAIVTVDHPEAAKAAIEAALPS